MSREVHVRFWESVEVRFLRATQLGLPTEPPRPAPARAPPQCELDFDDFDEPELDVPVIYVD